MIAEVQTSVTEGCWIWGDEPVPLVYGVETAGVITVRNKLGL